MKILNLGAGIQSTTIYLMMLSGELPSADVAIFADTQEEPNSVYKHLEWLQSLNGVPIHIVTAGKLGNDLIQGKNSTGQRFASIPAFTIGDERKVGKLRRQCTSEYKLNPIMKHFRYGILKLRKRQRMIGTHDFIFGISLDEQIRSVRILKNAAKWQLPKFPLIEKMMTRKHCIQWLQDYKIPHEVPRSACVFCPYKDNNEWARLKYEDPEGWNRAVEVDEALRADGTVMNRKMNQQLFLHRSCQPLSEVNFAIPEPTLGFVRECKGMCGS